MPWVKWHQGLEGDYELDTWEFILYPLDGVDWEPIVVEHIEPSEECENCWEGWVGPPVEGHLSHRAVGYGPISPWSEPIYVSEPPFAMMLVVGVAAAAWLGRRRL